MSSLESAHEREEFGTEVDELRSNADRTTPEQAEAAVSGHLVRLIDFFFALVAAQGILRFDEIVRDPFGSSGTAILALVVIYYTVIRSFIAWHSAIEQWRYRIFVPEVRTTELWRVYTDVLIVVVYAFLLLTAEPLIRSPGADVEKLLFGFPVLFLLYDLWGHLRRVAWGAAGDPFDHTILRVFAGLYLLLALYYWRGPDLGVSDVVGNVIALAAAGLLMVGYRLINFWQGPLYTDRKRWKRIPIPHVPRLRSSAEAASGETES